MYLDSDKRPAITPQLAFRVAVIGGFALIMFAVIFFRLWYLQILSGDKYLAEANDNRIREIKVQAPRGEIVDREGRVLVDNRVGLAIKVRPDEIPPAGSVDRAELYARLARTLDLNRREVRARVEEQLKAQPFSSATVKQDVGADVVAYLAERSEDFPAVEAEAVSLRQYPHREVGAHLFGTVGEVTEQQLDETRYRGVSLGDRVGQSGIEYSYDRFLRGKNGKKRVQVNAMGVKTRDLRESGAQAGRNLRLGIDLDVQRAGQQALGGSRGAFVVMHAKTGEIVALGSSPAFDPNIFAKIIRESDFKRLSSEENGKPLFNRAIQAGYPTGSTFKLVTSVAALQGGLITPDTPLFDGGSLRVGGVTFKNAGDAAYGTLSLRRALTVSSDVFFYQLGLSANNKDDGLLIQNWARRLGMGRLTGVDLPAEGEGLIPTPAWRNALFKKKLTDRPWSVGDNINLSIGQGDLSVTPIQLAVAYASVANGGYIVKPHLGKRIEDADGRVLQELETPSRRRVDIDPAYRQAIMEGLVGAANAPGGTSTAVFDGFNIPIAGKTGTAEKGLGRPDQSWYAAITYPDDPQYVVVATDEAGGFGAERAAPMVRQIVAALYDAKDKGPTTVSRVSD